MKLSESSTIVCNASPDDVFDIIRHSAYWPELFEPCVSVEHLAEDEHGEHIRVAAMVNGEKMQWETQRTFLSDVRGINGRSVKTMPLVRSMETHWRVVPINQAQSLLLLEHLFTIESDVKGIVDGVETQAEAEAFLRRAMCANSTRELGNIKAIVESQNKRATWPRHFSTTHSITCDAPAKTVYDALVDVANWPLIIDACTAAKEVSRDGNCAVVRVDAVQGGQAVWWETQRTYYDNIYRIDFHLPIPMPLLEKMSGEWRVVPLSDNRCVMHVIRDFVMAEEVDGIRPDIHTPDEAAEFIHDFACQNGEHEMAAIKCFVEHGSPDYMAFETTHVLPFAPDKVFSALADATRWPEIMPHCKRVDMLFDDGCNQEFLFAAMAGESEERFRSIRHCDAAALHIQYFQPEPPAVLSMHEGEWRICAEGSGCKVIAGHKIRVNLPQAAQQFNNDDLRANKQHIRDLIAKNSAAALTACSDWLVLQTGGDA